MGEGSAGERDDSVPPVEEPERHLEVGPILKDGAFGGPHLQQISDLQFFSPPKIRSPSAWNKNELTTGAAGKSMDDEKEKLVGSLMLRRKGHLWMS